MEVLRVNEKSQSLDKQKKHCIRPRASSDLLVPLSRAYDRSIGIEFYPNFSKLRSLRKKTNMFSRWNDRRGSHVGD